MAKLHQKIFVVFATLLPLICVAAVVDREAKVGETVTHTAANGTRLDVTSDAPATVKVTVTPGDDAVIRFAGPATRPATRPATLPSVEEPTTRPQIPLGIHVAGDGLRAALAAARPGDHFLLSGRIAQTLVGEVFVDVDCTIEGLQPTFVRIVSKNGGQAGLVVRGGARVNLRNLIGYTDYQGTSRSAYPATLVKYRNGGGDVINCRGERLDQLVKCEPGARDVLVDGCETDAAHRGYGVWVDGDGIVIRRSRFRSVIEHPIRVGEDGNYQQLARNVQIVDCDLSRPLNAGKECLTIRKADGVLVERVRCYLGEPGQLSRTGYAVRFGYDDPREPKLRNVTVRDLTVGNGVVDFKRGNFGGNVAFTRVRIEGQLPEAKRWEGDALWLNGLPVTLTDVTWNGKPVD